MAAYARPFNSFRRINHLILTLTLALLAACSSIPDDWKGMSTDEISQWQQIGFKAEAAQRWKKAGFDPIAADSWNRADFNLKDAVEWYQEKFDAREAQSWVKGGFDLDDAIENRAKGLSPIGYTK